MSEITEMLKFSFIVVYVFISSILIGYIYIGKKIRGGKIYKYIEYN